MNNQEYSKQIAQTIIEQIEAGHNMTVMGRKVSNMKLIGAHDVKYGTKGIYFFVKAKGKKFNQVMITLNAKDLYNVEFWVYKNFECKLIKNYEDIYNSELGNLIVNEVIN